MAKKQKVKMKAKAKIKTKTKAKAKATKKPAAKSKKAAPVAKSTRKTAPVSEKFLMPLEDRLLIEVIGPSETTAGGIVIPGTASQRPHRGRVLAKGPGRRNKKGARRPLDVSVGDEILFAEFAGTKISFEGTEALILREEEVLGVAT